MNKKMTWLEHAVEGFDDAALHQAAEMFYRDEPAPDAETEALYTLIERYPECHTLAEALGCWRDDVRHRNCVDC